MSPVSHQDESIHDRPDHFSDPGFAEHLGNSTDEQTLHAGADAELQRSLEQVAAHESWLNAGNNKGVDLNVLGEQLAELSLPESFNTSGDGSSDSATRTLVVVDTRVSNWQEIAESLPADADLLLLDEDRSGLQQIEDTARSAQRTGLSYGAVALVGSSNDLGEVSLGSDTISTEEDGAPNQRLSALETDLLGGSRIRLFSDIPAESLQVPQETTETSSSNPVSTTIGAEANELLVSARLNLRTAMANGTAATAIRYAFDETNQEGATAKLQKFLDGKTKPTIQWANFDTQKIQGAFVASTNTILISEELKESGNVSHLERVVLEEIGHWLEAELIEDSSGDEGDEFAKALSNS